MLIFLHDNFLAYKTDDFSYQYEGNSGSHDTGDPTTTNLFISNINPAVSDTLYISCSENDQKWPLPPCNLKLIKLILMLFFCRA